MQGIRGKSIAAAGKVGKHPPHDLDPKPHTHPSQGAPGLRPLVTKHGVSVTTVWRRCDCKSAQGLRSVLAKALRKTSTEGPVPCGPLPGRAGLASVQGTIVEHKVLKQP